LSWSCWLIEIFAFCWVSRNYLAGQETEQVVDEARAQREEQSGVQLRVRKHEVDPILHLLDEELHVLDRVFVERELSLAWRRGLRLSIRVGRDLLEHVDFLCFVFFEGEQPRAGILEHCQLVLPHLLEVGVLLEVRA
jgi:hypothetical protein